MQDYPCGLNPTSNKKQTSLLKTTTLNSTTCKSLFELADPPTTSSFRAHVFSHLLLIGEHHQCKNVLQDYLCGLNPTSNKKQISLHKETTLNSTTWKSLFRVSRSSYNFFFSSPRILSPTAHWGTSSMQKSYHSLTRPTSTSSTPPSSNNFSLIIAKWLHTL